MKSSYGSLFSAWEFAVKNLNDLDIQISIATTANRLRFLQNLVGHRRHIFSKSTEPTPLSLSAA
jgi:soluble P-type ATPase